MSPILEPKPNVRLHEHSPEALLDKVVDMIASSQGAPFLLNFDERSIAGMLEEAKRAGVESLINEDTVFDYASVGCLENTMCGNDRSATVDCNPNLVKAVELALGGGSDLITYTDALWGKPYEEESEAPKTGDPRSFTTFEEFYQAFSTQLCYVIQRTVALYERSTALRAEYAPTPYLSCLVRGCAEKALDCTQGGAELSFVTIEGVTFATTVDSLLAIKYLVFAQKLCDMDTLIKALKANWKGYEILQAHAKNRAPKYGRDDDAADALALRVMHDWTEEVWKHKTVSPSAVPSGMLSWNYWIGPDSCSPRLRRQSTRHFLSNAICPVNGADTNAPPETPTPLARRSAQNELGVMENMLPNGASHTITLRRR
jgi:formate C-acetyltransferase